MNAGEPPDEAGEGDEEEPAADPGNGDADSDRPDAESPDAGDGSDELDPDQEVEAAVEEALGPGVLDDGEQDGSEAADSEANEADEDGGDGLSSGGDLDGDAEQTGAASGDAPRVDDTDSDTQTADADDTEPDGDGVASGDGSDPMAGDDADPVAGDGESYRREEPASVDDDPADGDEIDESAAVEAARELVDGADAGDGPEPNGAAGATGSERAEETTAASRNGDEPDGATAAASDDAQDGPDDGASSPDESRQDVPDDVRKYDRFKKIDGGTYDRANEFLRDRTYITAREWAMARLCADFRTETGVEMTKIGNNLPELVPFMTDTYTPQAVNQARAAFEEKVRKAGATFLYGAMCDFFTAEELDDVMYEATEVAKFLLEVEGVELSVEEELAAEDHISEVMRDVREHSAALRHDEVTCPECGHSIETHE